MSTSSLFKKFQKLWIDKDLWKNQIYIYSLPIPGLGKSQNNQCHPGGA